MTEREVIVIDPQAQARKQFLDEMRELEKNPPDRAPKPGGYYLNADGAGAHDSEGRPVPLRGSDKDQSEDVRRMAARRSEAEALETEALDSPEEVADRGLPTSAARGPWTPAAVEPGQILSDGSSSAPDASKKARKGK